jgi:hypothetical protein
MNFLEKSFEFRITARRFILVWFRPATLVTEKSREELNATLKKHWPNNSIQVHELVFENWNPPQPPREGEAAAPSDNFIVFIDPEFDVDWISDAALEEDAAECVSRADSIGARRCQHLPREQVLELKRLIGQAIVTGIGGNIEQSRKLTSEAAHFLKDRTIERSRAWTLASAHCLIFVFAAVLWILLPTALECSIAFWLATAGGVIGAYLSLIQKAGSGEWDAASGLGIHVLEVFTKLIAGATFGGISYAISQSVNAPPSIKAVTPDSYSIFIFGLAAGLFERLIPKMVSKYSKTDEMKGSVTHES